jgi:acyl carrier protein
MSEVDRQNVWNAIVDSLRELMQEQEQDLGTVTEQTCVSRDLGISSIDMIHLMVALEDRLNRPLSIDELATDAEGQFRQDITLGDLFGFVLRRVNGSTSTGTPAVG